MSEEEKKIENAIDRLNYINRNFTYLNQYSTHDLDCIETILNLIEKQQKEIEELKSENYELNNRINDLLDSIPESKNRR